MVEPIIRHPGRQEPSIGADRQRQDDRRLNQGGPRRAARGGIPNIHLISIITRHQGLAVGSERQRRDPSGVPQWWETGRPVEASRTWHVLPRLPPSTMGRS